MAANFLHKLLNELPEESRWVVMENFAYLPQQKIYELLLQLEQDILRKVVAKKGTDSEEYKFFKAITNVLYQAGEAASLIEGLNNELQGFKEYNEYLHKRNAELEVKITRWQTIEDLQREGLLEIYIKRVQEILEKERKNGN